MLPQAALAEMGYGGVLYANAALQCAMLAISRTLAHLKDVGSLHGAEENLIGFAQRQDIVDFARWSALDQRYAE
jgi:2-methylisocitrate lyase-like PEP mutase family enzyme